MFLKLKKGQGDASAAATLIAIIGALIVLYIMFLPPEERAELLEDEDEGVVKWWEEKGRNLTLLSVSPERLYPVEEREFERFFSPVNIFIGEEGIVLKSIDSLYAKRSLFSKKEENFSFRVDNERDVKSALLNFFVDKGKGRLMVFLNGKEIFNREVKKGNIDPINLKEQLKEGVNDVGLSVSSPGAVFWRTNEYALEDISVTADITRKDAEEGVISFVVEPEERDNLRRVKLRFVPECVDGKIGALSVFVNDFQLYSGIPECNDLIRPLEFLPEKLNIGENSLRFRTARGQYLIDEIKLSSELKEVIAPVYYFRMDRIEFDSVDNRSADTILYIEFVDDDRRKVADIFVNDNVFRLDQYNNVYNETINNWIEEGNNAIRIEADEVLDIVDLRVYLDVGED